MDWNFVKDIADVHIVLIFPACLAIQLFGIVLNLLVFGNFYTFFLSRWAHEESWKAIEEEETIADVEEKAGDDAN